jgi:copper oxidase (laccase) domain-containing protein
VAVEDHDTHWTWEAPGALAVFSTREGGVSPAPWDSRNVGLHVGDDADRVGVNRTRVAALLELAPSQVAGVTQVHGADVWLDLSPDAPLPDAVRWDTGPSPIDADALVTTRAEAALAVGIADCVPIAIAWGGAIAAIHAGWRSLAGDVIEATMRVLRRAAGDAVAVEGVRPYAVIGPCICANCMEVGEEVAELFDPGSIRRPDGTPRPFLDQRHEVRLRLEAAGCLVEDVEACTVEDPRCFSHRGDAGSTGRQALLIRRIP